MRSIIRIPEASILFIALAFMILILGLGCTISVTDENNDGGDHTTPSTINGDDAINLIGPLNFKYLNSPSPLPLYPPDDQMPTSNDLPKFDIVASRTSGVAPLYVFFETSKPLKAADGDVDLQATYLWSFDTTKVDPNNRYNRVSGFVAGHVFNLPGTYTVRVDVFDKNRKHGYQEITITVTPFKGTTYYVSSAGSDDNPGTFKQPFKTAKRGFEQAKPNTRILFRNGDVFPLTETELNGDGPVIISGYNDDLSKPVTTMPTLHSKAVDAEWWALSVYGNDWRIVGVKVIGDGPSFAKNRHPGGIQILGKNNLVSRCELSNLGSGFYMSGPGAVAIYETNIHDIGTYGFYVEDAAKQVSIIGNYVHHWVSDQEEHGYRMQKGSGVFIGFNVFEVNDAKSGVQIRGDSDHVVLYGNVLDRSNGVHPQAGTKPPVELQHHVVIDSNVFIGRSSPYTDLNYDNGLPFRDVAIAIAAKDIVVRNNIIFNYSVGIEVEDDRPNIDRSERIWIENNTVLSPVVGSIFISQRNALAVSIMNNVHYSTASSSNQYDKFLDLGDTPFDAKSASDHNLFFGKSWSKDMVFFGPNSTLADWQARGQDASSKFDDPGIAVIEPTGKDFAKPSTKGPVVDTAIAIGNWADANGRLRGQSSGNKPDLGAFEVAP